MTLVNVFNKMLFHREEPPIEEEEETGKCSDIHSLWKVVWLLEYLGALILIDIWHEFQNLWKLNLILIVPGTFESELIIYKVVMWLKYFVNGVWTHFELGI